jgi:hypothetical protein
MVILGIAFLLAANCQSLRVDIGIWRIIIPHVALVTAFRAAQLPWCHEHRRRRPRRNRRVAQVPRVACNMGCHHSVDENIGILAGRSLH